MVVKAVVVFVEWQDNLQSAALDAFVLKGISGRLVWRRESSLEQDLLVDSPVQYTIHTSDFHEVVRTAPTEMVVLKGRIADLEQIITDFSETTRMTVVVSPAPFPTRRPTSYDHLLPRPSYCFSNGLDISPQVEMTVCAFYVEYEKNYTRKDWLTSFQAAWNEVGGCGIILAEHYLKELGYRFGKCKKYGA